MSNKRKLSNCGNRPKAFWGAVIGSLISAGAGLYAQSKQAREQARLQREQIEEQNRLMREANERNRAQQTASTLNNYASALEEIEEEPYVKYKSGGRRKLRNAGLRLTDGGPIVSSTGELIYPGQVVPPGTYRDLGPSHNQTNLQGRKGTGARTSTGKPFETQGGETWVVKPNEVMIFSKDLQKDGVSYADQAWSGKNPYLLEKDQAKSRKRHLRDGKSTPVERNRAALGAQFYTPDYIGLGTNILGSILANTYASSAYDDLLGDINYVLPEFTEESYVEGPTEWRNAAQRAEVERARLSGRRSIARNTVSSAVGLGRMQELDTNAMYELNKLWDEKANKETEMRQANVAREQEVRARNAAAKNQWSQNVATIQNQQLATKLGLQQAKVDSNVGMIQGIGSSIGGFLQQGIDNYQNENAMLAQIASSPYGTAEKLYSLGYKFSDRIVNSLANEAKSRMGRFANDNSESGIKSYNDALDSYNFWSTKLGNTNSTYSKRINPLVNTTKKNSISGRGYWYNPRTKIGGV